MNTKQELDAHLAEAMNVCTTAQREKRGLTPGEKASVEDHLEKAQDAKEWLGLADQIERMRGGSFSSTAVGRAKATVTVATGGLPNSYDPGATLQVASEGFRVRDLFPSQGMDSPSIWYRRITTGAAQAAAVAEAAAKPEATIVADQLEAVARKLAVWVPASDEVIADGGQSLLSDLVADLARDLVRVENAQLLNGNGTAPNLRGILNTSGVQTRARGTDTNLDALLKATTMLRVNAYTEPTALVLHPTNWETVRLSKDTTESYVLGDPLAQGQPTIAGAPVYLSTDMPLGTGLVMNATEAAKVYLRQDITVDVGYTGVGFTTNVTAIRAEERIAFAVRRPAAAVSVTALN